MMNPIWTKALKACADPHRAKHYLDQLAATGARAALEKSSAEQARILAVLFSGSQVLSESLIANPGWLASLSSEYFSHPRRAQGLGREAAALLKPLVATRDFTGAFNAIRQFKQREMLRIGARDLARLGNVSEITRELSDLADVCLDSVWQLCCRQFIERFGAPFHQDANRRWHPTEFCIFGLGKLGGQELNYSSDVDVMFVYSDEGFVFKEPPKAPLPARRHPLPMGWGEGRGEGSAHGMANHQFFSRLAKSFIEEITRMTSDGVLYRIDLRLRPEGDSGPLVRSLPSCENYYAQWGQTWERMMLIKARRVAGDESLAHEFLEMIQSFRYPRSLGEDFLRELAATKERIENEVVKAGEIERNVKLGRGGIREIEFTAQALQLLHAGRQPFLQGAQTLPTLEKLVQYHLLSAAEARSLAEAYCFLRDVEHRLQMENNMQTHTIPEDEKAQHRLAKLMGFGSLKEFESARQSHTRNVRRSFEKLLGAPHFSLSPSGEERVASRRERGRSSAGREDFPASFDDPAAEEEWKQILSEHSFRDPGQAFRMLKEFVEGPGFIHVSPRTAELARQLIPKFFALCPQQSAIDDRPLTILSDPDRVLTRLDSFITAYGARATLFESWNRNPAIFEMLLWVFDRSEFLAEIAIRTPDLIDSLVVSGHLRRSKTAEETLKELRHGAADEDQLHWLRRYHQAEFMRIGLRDILGFASPRGFGVRQPSGALEMFGESEKRQRTAAVQDAGAFDQTDQIFAELTVLADACLQYALEIVTRKNKLKSPLFAIIGLGKLGGAELNYGSDLDIVFVADDKTKNLPKLQRMAAEVMELLSKPTEFGIAFHTDARLRPDGEKGLLVNTLAAYEEYYRQRAQLWEVQAISRTRFVAGDAKLGKQFQELAVRLTDFKAVARISSSSPHDEGVGRGPRRGANRKRASSPRPSPPSDGGEGVDSCIAFTPDWKKKIHAMRMRIEKERTPAGQDELAIKTGKGGLMDAEFIAQVLCMENGWQEANTMRALERARALVASVGDEVTRLKSKKPKKGSESPHGVSCSDLEKLIANYNELRRLERILRRWSFEGETALPDEPAPFYRVAVRCGFATAEDFRKAVAGWRTAIREVYDKVFK